MNSPHQIILFQQDPALLGALAGAISYVIARQQKAGLKLHATFATALQVALTFQQTQELTSKQRVLAFFGFLAIVTVSEFVQRCFFHPLSYFSGPFLARFTDAYRLHGASKGNQARDFAELHRKYGDYVRVGPNRLSVRDASALPVIYGAKGWNKGEWIKKTSKVTGTEFQTADLVNTIDIAEHARRRRTWDQSFSSASLASYQPIVREKNAECVDAILRRGKVGTVDMAKEMSFYAWSVMYMIGFGGHGVDLIEDGIDKDDAIAGLCSAMNRLVNLLLLPDFMIPFYNFLPRSQLAKGFFELVMNQYWARSADMTMSGDVMSSLLRPIDLEKDPKMKEQLKQEAMVDTRLLIIAHFIRRGADTTSSAMSGIWYYMLSEPGKKTYKALQAALDKAYAEVEVIDHLELSRRVPLLDAVIWEAQRLMPSVATGPMFREAPANGAVIGGKFVPSGTEVCIPQAVMGRDPRYFQDPSVYRPERWFNGEPINKNAFQPFSIGPRACIGRILAMQEMRLLVSDIMRSCEVDLVPNFDGPAWLKSWSDFGVSQIGKKLEVVIQKRE